MDSILRVFVSYGLPFDRLAQEQLLRGMRAAGANLRVVAWSRWQDGPYAAWLDETREAIDSCDLVLALVGDLTRLAGNVGDEVEIAREIGVPVFAVSISDDPSPPDNVTCLLEPDWVDLRRRFAGVAKRSR